MALLKAVMPVLRAVISLNGVIGGALVIPVLLPTLVLLCHCFRNLTFCSGTATV